MSWLTDHPHKIYTIAPGLSFVDELAASILASCAGDDLALSRMRILLPTRRAVQGMRDAFLRQTGGRPLLLPQMQAVGAPDEDELSFLADTDPAALPPQIPPARRLLLLVPLIRRAFGGQGLNYEQALGMASALALFMDELYTEDLSLDDLDRLVDDANLATNWQLSTKFLREIIQEHWPRILAAYGCIDPGLYRVRLLHMLADHWRISPPADPVIVAGTMASVPAVATLLQVVMAMPAGRIILPGFDRHMDVQSYDALDEGHPQYLLKTLLGRLGAAPTDVAPFPRAARPDQRYATTPPQVADVARSMRVHLASEMMRPAATLGKWALLPQEKSIDHRAIDGVTLYEAKTLTQEARVIGCILRDVLDDVTQTAIVVTPNRTLAAFVKAELLSWGIDIDDSAGEPLSQSLLGRWFLSALTMVAEGLSPVSLLSFLKNEFASGGAVWPEQFPYARFVRLFEQDICRGVRLYGDLDALDVHLRGLTSHKGESLWAGHPEKIAGWEVFKALLARLMPLANGRFSAPEGVRTVLSALEDFAATQAIEGARRLWAGDAGEQAARFFSGLLDTLGEGDDFTVQEFRDFMLHMMNEAVIRPRYGMHPRIAILGLMEARLQTADVVILGGLNEKSWPADPGHNPWMSRPMARQFGLPRPERVLTQSAHDFIQLFCAPRVHMTRAMMADNAPTVPSRWLKRLDTVMATLRGDGADAQFDVRRYARLYLDRALALHRPQEPVKTAPRPAPNLPEGTILDRLSITDAGALQSDPYALYAKRILGLYKLDPIDQAPDALMRGNLYHEAVEIFTRKYPDSLPDDPQAELLSIGKDVFARAGEWNAEIHGFWWPRYQSMAVWLAAQEQDWRDRSSRVTPEAKGEMTLAADGGRVVLSGRADRVERRLGGFSIIDYKTGSKLPSKTDVGRGVMPQLTLGGAMLRGRHFADVHYPAAGEDVAIDTLAYWKITGKDDEIKIIAAGKEADDLCTAAIDGLSTLLGHFNGHGGAFLSCPYGSANAAPMSKDYFHLARVKEWAVAEDAEEDAA